MSIQRCRRETDIHEENGNDVNGSGRGCGRTERESSKLLESNDRYHDDDDTRKRLKNDESSVDDSYAERKLLKDKRKSNKKTKYSKKRSDEDRRYDSDESTSNSNDSEEMNDEDSDLDRKQQIRNHKNRKHSKSNKKRSKEEKKSRKHSSKKKKKKSVKRKYQSSDEDSRESYKVKKSKRHRDKSNGDDDVNDGSMNVAVFGKYGILKATDYNRMQRTFEIWLAEVKGIHAFTGPKWELQKYFDEYREDYNTVTLPHIKYYNYEKWEMEEYSKNKKEQQEALMKTNDHNNSNTVKSDELIHRQEQIKQRQIKQTNETIQLLSTMNKEKVQDMKHQADLRAQMQIAFKTGDKATYRRLKEKLEADV